MTVRRTSNSSKGLWTGLITLLLISATVRSQTFSNVTTTPTTPTTTTTRATIIEEPSGNSTSPKIESTSASLKRVNDRPEARPEAVAKIVTNVTSKFEDVDVQGDPVIKREKPKVTLAQSEVEKIEGKRLATEFLPEFVDKEDYDEVHDLDDKNDDREPTTPPPTKKPGEKKNGAPNKIDDTKEFGNSNEYDFKEIDEQNSDNNYSLVNDTNVNYIASKIAKAAKNEDIYGNDYKSVKANVENPTNLITSGDDEQPEAAKGPKSQVEVFKNSTLPKVLRLSEDKAERTVDAISIQAENTKNSINDGNKTNGTTFNGAESVDRKSNDERIPQIPRGRTIAFGGSNEFLNQSTKTGESKVAIGTADFPEVAGITEKSVDEPKSLSFKPYPYLKVIQFDLLSNVTSPGIDLSSDRVVAKSKEEASALENAIGQKQEEGQIVVTESSVVIDNSIQQFKPSHPKRSGNSSRSSAGLSLTFATTSSTPLDNDKTVTMTSTESINLENGTTLYASNLRISNVENDVPRGNDESTSVVNKDTSNSLDLSGNGITEITQSGKNDSSLAIENYAARTETVGLPTIGTAVTRATVSNLSVQNTTEGTISEDDTTIMEVRTNVDDSMLKISPLDVIETSTITPSTQSVTTPTEIPSTTASMSTKVTGTSTSGSKLEEPATTISSQGLEVSVPVTSEPEEASSSEIPNESTTSKVEYEFIGLTDSTVSQKFIASTETSNVLGLNDEDSTSSTSFSLLESTTFTPIPALSTSTPAGPETTPEILENQETSTYPATLVTEMESSDDETTVFTTQVSGDPEDATFVSEVQDATTTSDFLSTETNESTEPTTEIVYEDTTNFAKVTEILPEVGNSTDSGRSVDSSTYSPESSTRSGNSSSTSEVSTDSSNFSVVTDHPEFTVTSRSPLEDSTSSTSTTETITTFVELDSSSENPSTSENPINTVTVNNTGPGGRAVTPDELTALVRIVFEGTWLDICPHLPDLRQSLADLLTSGLEKVVMASQIVFEKNPCTDGSAATMATTELSLTTLLLYVVDKNGNYDAEMTKILPTLYSRSPIKLQVTIHSFQLVQDADSSNAIAVVVVSCVAFICLVLLAGLLFIMRKRQTRFNYGERCRPVSLDAYSLDSVSAYNSVRGRKGVARASKRSYGNPTFEDSTATPSHPLNFAGLSTFCNEQNIIAEEFSGIPQVTARIDELPPGAEVKNRYANVVPLPETRVSLMKINNDPLTEYINASYVRGPKNATKYYIACQAPIESTVTDFWRMIWEQQSKVVIMLTDLAENGVEKCAEYLPPSEVTDCHRLFGDFQVTLKKRETKEKYAISTLHLKNLENNTFREISHIWYLWPANGVQSDAAGLIAVLLEARALQRGGPGPVVVHCSPGTGRTGTLIALDLGIRQYEITRTVDVPRVVYTIRRDRAGAVQTTEQYAFIYKALNLYATKLAGGALES